MWRKFVIIGKGKMATELAIAAAAANLPTRIMHEIDNCQFSGETLYIVATDRQDNGIRKTVLQKTRKANAAVLSVTARLSQVFVGPLELPGCIPCLDCFEIRWENAKRRAPLRQIMKKINESRPGFHPEMMLTVRSEVIRSAAQFTVTEIQAALREETLLLKGKVAIWDGAGETVWRTLHPASECPRCNHKSFGIRDSVIRRQNQFQTQTCSYDETLRSKKWDLEQLAELYADQDLGPISGLYPIMKSGEFVGVDARLEAKVETVFGFGLATSEAKAKQTAIFEALERQCFLVGESGSEVWGNYLELQPYAVHPGDFGLYDERVYETREELEAFSEEKSYPWLWGCTCRDERQVLVPRQLVYAYPLKGESKFVIESSNGWAVGNTFAEAALHGLLEVLERDLLLNTWYGQIPIPEFSIDEVPSVKSEYLRWLDKQDFDVRFFDMSLDLEFPAVMAVAVNRRGVAPMVVGSAAVHLYLYQATNRALSELAAQIFALQGVFKENSADIKRKFENRDLMFSVRDQSAVAALPEAYPEWRFLLEQPAPTYRAEMRNAKLHPAAGIEEIKEGNGNIQGVLRYVADQLHQRGHDVIVCDGTSPELWSGGLKAAKVLVPGMLPITFGNGARRVRGLPRVLRLPHQLGYASAPLRENSLNPHPHPFS